jgi:phage shock protein A
MFESLRQAFREAVDNFRTELNRDRVPEAADRLLKAMEQELISARTALSRLEDEVAAVEAQARAEEEEARTCLRRETMALKIDDEETAKVARDFAAKHLRRKDLLQEKASVLKRELADRKAEAAEMMEQLGAARVHRESLLATAGRTGARDQLQQAEDLFEEMDRMAERIQDMESRVDATGEVDDLLDPAGSRRSPPPPADDVDARLEELKRRMGRD